jgi:chromosome segregation ATPase
MESLRRELASAQIVHDNRRHQLDLQVTEVDDLKQALDERVAELRNAASTNDKLSSERDRLRTEKDRLNSERAQLISVLEADMKRVRKDAERFAKDLQDLRVERDALNARRREDKEQAERTNSQAQAQIKTLTEQLESIRRKAGVAERNLTDHVCSRCVLNIHLHFS